MVGHGGRPWVTPARLRAPEPCRTSQFHRLGFVDWVVRNASRAGSKLLHRALKSAGTRHLLEPLPERWKLPGELQMMIAVVRGTSECKRNVASILTCGRPSSSVRACSGPSPLESKYQDDHAKRARPAATYRAALCQEGASQPTACDPFRAALNPYSFSDPELRQKKSGLFARNKNRARQAHRSGVQSIRISGTSGRLPDSKAFKGVNTIRIPHL
jgi:hypothetical protein